MEKWKWLQQNIAESFSSRIHYITSNIITKFLWFYFKRAQNNKERPADQACFWNDSPVRWQPSWNWNTESFSLHSTAEKLQAQPPGTHQPLGYCWKGAAVLGGFKAISLAALMHFFLSQIFLLGKQYTTGCVLVRPL